MNVLNHIITSRNEVISFKTPENSLFDIARNCMFYNKGIVTLPLYSMAFKEKPLTQRLSSRVGGFRSCSFEEAFNRFRPSRVEVKLSDHNLNCQTIKLTNRAKNNGSSPLISKSIYLIGPLSNSLYPTDNAFLKHQSFNHYRYNRHIPLGDIGFTKYSRSIMKINLINKILNKKKGIDEYEFL